jgi:hypothetical protein
MTRIAPWRICPRRWTISALPGSEMRPAALLP